MDIVFYLELFVIYKWTIMSTMTIYIHKTKKNLTNEVSSFINHAWDEKHDKKAEDLQEGCGPCEREVILLNHEKQHPRPCVPFSPFILILPLTEQIDLAYLYSSQNYW